jgi:hypothetical protein
MSDMPVWFGQLRWTPAVPVSHLVGGMMPRSDIVEGSGLYAFTTDDQALSTSNALYIGKTDGVTQSLRRRLGQYINRFGKTGGPSSEHAGMERLAKYYTSPGKAMYVRWCGCTLTRETEGGLIDLFSPRFNGKYEGRALADDERIPAVHLYDA